VWFSWLKEEEEAAIGGSWTILDNKHTLLFNHVYENNREGNLKYLDKIAQALTQNPQEGSIDLDYAETKEREWITQWKLRTASSDQILERIIKKIQKATGGNKIEKLNLKSKGIYIGKYKIDDVEYPIAIYSEKDVIDNLTKVEVTEVSELEKEENKKRIRAEETFIKYMVIAFYEDNNPEPVLMMQIEKFDISRLQNTKEKWLEFLGIVKEKEILEPNNNEDIRGKKINAALEEMKQYLGYPYKFGGGTSRTSLDEKGTAEMDCSEFMSRFIQKVCGLEKVPEYTTALMKNWIENKKYGDDNLEYLKGSKDKKFKDIQPGDVFLWRTESGGHTGVVVSYNSTTDLVTIIEAIGESGASEESLSKNLTGYCKGCIRISVYTRTGKSLAGHIGWEGYFRPKIK